MIQGLAAEQTKIASVLIREELNEKGLNDVLLLVSQLHDEIFMQGHNDYLEIGAEILQRNMELAGQMTLGNNLLKAEAVITDRWYSNVA